MNYKKEETIAGNKADRFANEDKNSPEKKSSLKDNPPVMLYELKCTGCFSCMFYCSVLNYGHHNPHESYIQIISHDDAPNEIIFLDGCLGCGMCSTACTYGALVRTSA